MEEEEEEEEWGAVEQQVNIRIDVNITEGHLKFKSKVVFGRLV